MFINHALIFILGLLFINPVQGFENSTNFENITKYYCILNIGDIDEPRIFFKNRSMSYNFQTLKDTGDNQTKIYNLTDCDFLNPNISIKYKLNLENPKAVQNFITIVDIFKIKELKYQRNFLQLISNTKNNNTISAYGLWDFWYKTMYSDENLTDQEYIVDNQIQIENQKTKPTLMSLLNLFLPKTYTVNKTLNTKRGDEVKYNKWYFRLYDDVLTNREEDVYNTIWFKFNELEENNKTIFDVIGNNLQESLGFYNYDNHGRKALSFKDSFNSMFWGLLKNPFLLDEDFKKLTDHFKKSYIEIIPLFNHLYYFYFKFTTNKHWVDIKDRFYYLKSTLLSELNNAKRLFYTFDFTIEPVDTMNKKLKDQFFNQKLSMYMHSQTHKHLTRTNYLRHYNLPEYGSEDEWVLELQDLFDLDFYNPKKSHFEGFGPEDKKTLRPLSFMAWTILPLPTSFVPADTLSLFVWGWKWIMRSNKTRFYLPFLEDFYEPPDEEICLPAFPYLPDPAFGCSAPSISFLAPLIPIYKLPEFLTPGSCFAYVNPIRGIEGVFQIIFSRNLGKFVQDSSVLTWFVNLFPIKIIPTEELPYNVGICLLPKIILLIPLFCLFLFAVWIGIKMYYDQAMEIILESSKEGASGDIESLKQEVYYQHKTITAIALILYLKKYKKRKRRKKKTQKSLLF